MIKDLQEKNCINQDIRVAIETLPMNWKCVRCRQHHPECAPQANNYGLCYRCQDYMHHEMNDRCVACGNNEATDNLCDECRVARISEYDRKFLEKIKAEKVA